MGWYSGHKREDLSREKPGQKAEVHMNRKVKFFCAVAGVLVVILLGAVALAAGTVNDPLVTLSFLTDVFAPQVEQKVDAAVASGNEKLKADVDASIASWEEELKSIEIKEGDSSAFKVVTLSKDQVLTGNVGCEVMLRVGTAVCVSSEAPGLIDCTDAGILNNGQSLAKNHLYMITIDTRSVKATAATVKVLVRGPYTVK